MSGMFRLPDEAALDALLARSHVRVVTGKYAERAKPESAIDKPPPAPKEPKAKAPPKPKAKRESRIEVAMELAIRAANLPPPVRHYVYFEDRNYTGDFVWPARKTALEVDGGAHKTPARFDASHERHYLLTMAGWTVIHVGKEQVKDGRAIEWITTVLARTTPTFPNLQTADDLRILDVFNQHFNLEKTT